MTTQERHQRITQSMFQLVGNPAFADFIDLLRDDVNNTVIDMASDRVISDKRLLQTYLGEVRAYTNIISRYDNFVQENETRAVEASERSAG